MGTGLAATYITIVPKTMALSISRFSFITQDVATIFGCTCRGKGNLHVDSNGNSVVAFSNAMKTFPEAVAAFMMIYMASN